MGKSKISNSKDQQSKTKNDQWTLRLYIAGQTPKAVTAFNNLKAICKEQLKGNYSIKVIDLLKNPRIAHDHQIFAIPTLIRTLPQPAKRIIGDLSNTEKVLSGLNIVKQSAGKKF